MTRSDARELAAHLIYELDYTDETPSQAIASRLERGYYDELAAENELYTQRPNAKQMTYITACVEGVAETRQELDATISEFSVGWKLSRISRFAKAALRLAIYEILHVDDVPTGVAINECLELIRKYEDEEIVGFVNGILGSFARSLKEGKS